MAMEAILAYRTDILLFESAYIANRFETLVGKPRHLAHIVRNGIAPDELEPVTLKGDAADLLYVGEFRVAKGLDTLIDAMGLLIKTTNQRPSLMLVGDGLEKAALIARAQHLGISGQLNFQAPMAARAAFARGRIMVVPSRSESLPYIVLEAAGAHKPIIATRVGGMAEIFGPHSDRLIACGDPKILCDALQRALDESPREQQEKSRQLAEYISTRFPLSGMVDGIIGGYREALAIKARP
jgi:glycosyltransferase involved in cell wall biosynthesis